MIDEMIAGLTAAGYTVQPGLSEEELVALERRYARPIPPDWRALLARGVPVGDHFYDLRSAAARLDEAVAWPIEGLLFDVDEGVFWPEEWGTPPENAGRRRAIARQRLEQVPKLWPVYGHRYLPCSPPEEGNPVFSVYQSDVIVYGRDLAHWFAVELSIGRPSEGETARAIEFWSELAGF